MLLHKLTNFGFWLASLGLLAQPAGQGQSFAGTWEAKWHNTVICAMRLQAGEAITGQMLGCSVRVDDQGDLLDPEGDVDMDSPKPLLRLSLDGKTLRFEQEDDGEAIRFELTLTGERTADLRILDAPVKIKPIPFTRR